MTMAWVALLFCMGLALSPTRVFEISSETLLSPCPDLILRLYLPCMGELEEGVLTMMRSSVQEHTVVQHGDLEWLCLVIAERAHAVLDSAPGLGSRPVSSHVASLFRGCGLGTTPYYVLKIIFKSALGHLGHACLALQARKKRVRPVMIMPQRRTRRQHAIPLRVVISLQHPCSTDLPCMPL